jgi:hypothetical protein
MRSLSLGPEDAPRRIVAAVSRLNGGSAELVRALLVVLESHARGAGGGDGVAAGSRAGDHD